MRNQINQIGREESIQNPKIKLTRIEHQQEQKLLEYTRRMSSPGPMPGISKIHINNSTKISLSDRFTAFSARPKIQPRTSHRNVDSPVSRAASIANRRLLKQLAQKHTREAALKLKRRSMKPRIQTAAYKRVTNGVQIKRGSIKALRLGPSGRLMKANSITNVATMEADFMGRPSRRSNSTSRIAERVGGGGAGGVGRRVGRPAWRPNAQMNLERTPPPRATRSRSRSRTRLISALMSPSAAQAGLGQRMARPRRSNSRPRVLNRSRSRSSRMDRVLKMMEMRSTDSVPITSRLGVRPTVRATRARSASRGRTANARRGIASGRIQKRRASVKATLAGGDSLAGNVRSRLSRANGRPNATRGRARSRSRTAGRLSQKTNNGAARGGLANRQSGGAQRGSRGAARGTVARGGRRGRSQQRGGTQQRNGNGNAGQQQQRRGRSRSRGRRNSRGGRQIGGKPRPDVKREDLDKELDQYMSSTKNADV